MLPKILLFDLDFTLLRSDKTISQRTLKALQKAKQLGSRIGFCTSRGNTNIQNYINLVNPDIVISNGGGCIYLDGNLIHAETFNIEETCKILTKTYQIIGPNAEITIDTVDSLYWNRKENKSENFDPSAIYDDMKNFPYPAMKICVQTTDSQIASEISTCVPDCDFLRFSDIPWYKFSCSKATKENAIVFLSNYLAVPLEHFVSFGDDFSDIGMLKLCGIGVAMENAIPAVREIASQQTLSCDQDGVAVWLEQNF